MKKRTIVLLALGAIIVLAAATLALYPIRSPINQVALDLDEIANSAKTAQGDNATLATNSNPYTGLKSNATYKALVAKGYGVLPALSAELDASNEDGLRGYIACTAIEAITNCDLEQFPAFAWDRATVFRAKWDAYLNDMPERVTGILKSSRSPQSKRAALVKLGATAVPYLLKQASSLSKADGEELGAAAFEAADKPGTGSLADFSNRYGPEMNALLDYIESR